MMANQLFWSGRRVVVTGHTGFKGTWLCTWLAGLGCGGHRHRPAARDRAVAVRR